MNRAKPKTFTMQPLERPHTPARNRGRCPSCGALRARPVKGTFAQCCEPQKRRKV